MEAHDSVISQLQTRPGSSHAPQPGVTFDWAKAPLMSIYGQFSLKLELSVTFVTASACCWLQQIYQTLTSFVVHCVYLMSYSVDCTHSEFWLRNIKAFHRETLFWFSVSCCLDEPGSDPAPQWETAGRWSKLPPGPSAETRWHHHSVQLA